MADEEIRRRARELYERLREVDKPRPRSEIERRLAELDLLDGEDDDAG